VKASCVFIQGIIVLEPRVFVDERGFFWFIRQMSTSGYGGGRDGV
jgi:dTDP-4-dehydrorhamnose 3,5-epimerase-like enzyme